MFPPQFDYHRVESVEEALELLDTTDDAAVLAGGHALIPALKTGRYVGDAKTLGDAPKVLIDVSHLDGLRGVDAGAAENDCETFAIGAMTTYADLLAAAASLPASGRSDVLLEATATVGDRQIRNRGTVGGNLAEAHPDSDLPAAALAAAVSVSVASRDGTRSIPADGLFTGAFSTALNDDELLTMIDVPREGVWESGPKPEVTGGAYRKKTHPASGYAMVGVAAVVGVTDSTISHARVAANGVTSQAVRLAAVEDALSGTDVTNEDDIVASADDAARDIRRDDRRGDEHASGEFRAELLPTYTERAVRVAVSRARARADGYTVGVALDGVPDSEPGNTTVGDGGGGRP